MLFTFNVVFRKWEVVELGSTVDRVCTYDHDDGVKVSMVNNVNTTWAMYFSSGRLGASAVCGLGL